MERRRVREKEKGLRKDTRIKSPARRLPPDNNHPGGTPRGWKKRTSLQRKGEGETPAPQSSTLAITRGFRRTEGKETRRKNLHR